MKNMRNRRYFLFLLIAAILVPIIGGCGASGQPGFAIYLTRDDVPPERLNVLSNIRIDDQPVISNQDIISYDAQTHEITLTEAAFERISKLEVPMQGRSFIICVDSKPVYSGAFWTPLSSHSFDGVTICKPLSNQGNGTITISKGYPSPDFFSGSDPRSHPEILNALKNSGKLVTPKSAADVDQLPRAMKGYELYSWWAENEWNFKLITGTNRNKTTDEIVMRIDSITENGWVQIHAVGVEAILGVLAKIPRDEYVSWLAGSREDGKTGEQVKLTLPPQVIVERIKEAALRSGLQFSVYGSN
ncbi:MAG TPA: hypothetical protein VLH15_11800 [Dehalococcoidales bacterium]|nr:hypothetical protein [Dehalococcoidales bacterium]